jgi:hypothetical protein
MPKPNQHKRLTQTQPQPKRQSGKLRFFDGLPVREARGNILVKPTQDDIDHALRHNPQQCAYALCLKRMLQTKRVFVYHTVAYIETADEAGNPIMERYMIRNSAYHYIQAFDKGEPTTPGGFTLHKPNPSYTLEGKRRYYQSRKKNPERDALRRQYQKSWYQSYRSPKAKQLGKSSNQTAFSFRDGTGQVRFIGTYQGMIRPNPKPSLQ